MATHSGNPLPRPDKDPDVQPVSRTAHTHTDCSCSDQPERVNSRAKPILFRGDVLGSFTSTQFGGIIVRPSFDHLAVAEEFRRFIVLTSV